MAPANPHLLAQGLEQPRNRYEQLLDKQTQRFTDVFQQAGWLIPGAMPQTRIWAERVQSGGGRAVVFWVDALRYEMGASLHERFSGWSREQLSDLRLEIAQASLPSITPVGWSNDKTRRIAHLQQRLAERPKNLSQRANHTRLARPDQ